LQRARAELAFGGSLDPPYACPPLYTLIPAAPSFDPPGYAADIMQHTAPAPFDDRPPRLIFRHAPAAALHRVLTGDTISATARDIGWQSGCGASLGTSLRDAHASPDDISDLRAVGGLAAARVRTCICCGRPIVSAHPGVRMCVPCRVGNIDMRW